MSPTEIKNLMEKYGIAPKKLFGQNFLISEGILDKIVKSANLSKENIVLEVGPGLGALTLKMAPLVKQVIAIEKDRTLVKILQNRLLACHSESEFTEGEESQRSFVGTQDDSCFKNIEIIEQDILKFSITNFQFSNYKLIANIPYYLTSVLIRKFLESENKPAKIILMIQKEVAQRICAPKYDEKMNLLALSVQFYADTKILFYVSKENFWPAPKVDSAIIEITPKYSLPDVDEKIFFKIVRSGFANKRKQLAGNLSQNLKLPLISARHPERATPRHPEQVWGHPERSEGSELPLPCHPELVSGFKISKEKIEELLKQISLDPKTRAEELRLEDWIKLIKIYGLDFSHQK